MADELDKDEISREELGRQIAGHVESLRRAGLDWLPAGTALKWQTTSAVGQVANLPAGSPPVSQPPPRKQQDDAVSPHENRPAPVKAPAAPGRVPAFLAPSNLATELPVPDDAPANLTLDQRRQELKLLAEEVKGCMKCAALCSTRTQTVFGSGQPGVDICFVGEAPGADEDTQGFPFVGAAGQLLTKIIEACGLKRDEVYICNILKCRPPGNRTPLADEAANCRGFLERQIRLVRPKYIVALGACAATNLLNSTLSLGRLRGKFHDFQGIPVMVTYHPAYLLPHRSPDKKKDVWEDMKTLMARLGKPVPPKGT
jgi:uracil-DNA glycosylase